MQAIFFNHKKDLPHVLQHAQKGIMVTPVNAKFLKCALQRVQLMNAVNKWTQTHAKIAVAI